MPRKNAAAVALGKKRWKGTTKKERSAHMRRMILARWAKVKKERELRESE